MKKRRERRRSRRSIGDESDGEELSGRDDYKAEVVRRLVENFSLQDTVHHYRGLPAAEYVINPNNFTLDR